MSDAASDPQIFLDLIENLVQANKQLSGLQGALLVACALDIASDSRTFAKVFGVEHALALRELNMLIAAGEFALLTKRDPRTLRTHFKLTAIASEMMNAFGMMRGSIAKDRAVWKTASFPSRQLT
ncbi:hypothetical protein [Rhizobium sp. LEGMi135b]